MIFLPEDILQITRKIFYEIMLHQSFSIKSWIIMKEIFFVFLDKYSRKIIPVYSNKMKNVQMGFIQPIHSWKIMENHLKLIFFSKNSYFYDPYIFLKIKTII